MAVRLRDGEVYFAEEGTLNRSQLLMFFLNENIDSLVVVYDRSEKYQGAICYQSLLQTTAIEDAVIRDKVYLDQNIWKNIADVLLRYPDLTSLPVLTEDDRILYLAEDSPELSEWMMRLCRLEKEDAIWREIPAVRIKGFHEAFAFFKNFLEKKGIPVFTEREDWEKIGVSSSCKEEPKGTWTIAEDGEEVDQLYLKYRKNNVLEELCKEVKENGSEVIFCCAPGTESEAVYEILLREGIYPQAVWCLEQFHTLYGQKVISGPPSGTGKVYCFAGKKGNIDVDKMFDRIMRRQNGCCDNIWLLSELSDCFADDEPRHMIRHCGKAVLMGEKRLCMLLQTGCSGMGDIETAYVHGEQQIAESLGRYKDALWFWLDVPSKEPQTSWLENYEACRQRGIYLSRYFSDHYRYYEEAERHTCFTQDEIAQMNCLRKLQAMFDECRKDAHTPSDREREILFYGPLYSYSWSGVAPLFEYYMKQGNARCTVVFPSVWEIIKIGKRNLWEITDIVADIRSWGGQVGLYDDCWYLDRVYDVCYVILGCSPWHAKNGVFRSSKAVISLQTLAYHTHYYIGDESFERMFGEQHREEIDDAVVSGFLARWAGQKEKKWQKKLLALGYPKMDSLYEELQTCQIPDEWRRMTKGRRVFLFTVYCKELFQYCLEYCENDKAVLVWRPHPLSLESPQMKALAEGWKNRKNVLIDENPSYSPAFCISDALITTFCSSVQINYLLTDKPVLILDKGYLGAESNDIDFQEEAWYRAAYTANSKKECEDFIDMMIDGRDDQKEEKLPYRQFMQQGFDGKVCERIAAFAEQNYTDVRFFR